MLCIYFCHESVYMFGIFSSVFHWPENNVVNWLFSVVLHDENIFHSAKDLIWITDLIVENDCYKSKYSKKKAVINVTKMLCLNMEESLSWAVQVLLCNTVAWDVERQPVTHSSARMCGEPPLSAEWHAQAYCMLLSNLEIKAIFVCSLWILELLF